MSDKEKLSLVIRTFKQEIDKLDNLETWQLRNGICEFEFAMQNLFNTLTSEDI